eukprot:Tbor_TRINITY_DN3780_c0_g1::TRINITY_DN3780_c0_g1_i1::g.2352::m.2352
MSQHLSRHAIIAWVNDFCTNQQYYPRFGPYSTLEAIPSSVAALILHTIVGNGQFPINSIEFSVSDPVSTPSTQYAHQPTTDRAVLRNCDTVLSLSLANGFTGSLTAAGWAMQQDIAAVLVFWRWVRSLSKEATLLPSVASDYSAGVHGAAGDCGLEGLRKRARVEEGPSTQRCGAGLLSASQEGTIAEIGAKAAAEADELGQRIGVLRQQLDAQSHLASCLDISDINKENIDPVSTPTLADPFVAVMMEVNAQHIARATAIKHHILMAAINKDRVALLQAFNEFSTMGGGRAALVAPGQAL